MSNAMRPAPTASWTQRVRRSVPPAVLAMSLVWAFAAPAVHAAGLMGLSVVLSSLAPGHANTRVLVRFALEEGGPALSPSDYIRIRFEGFSNVSPPTGGGGWTGEPSFGVAGNVAFVTGVAAAPGAVITVTGVSVTNPRAGADRSVSVELAPDLLSGDPFASSAAQPTGGEHVTVSGVVPSTDARVVGLTSPGATVFVVARDDIVGDASANEHGAFNSIVDVSSLPGIVDGEVVTFTLTAQDVEERRAAPVAVAAPLRLV